MITEKEIEQLKIVLQNKREELKKELACFADQENANDWQTRYPNVPGEGWEEEADEVEEYENLLPVEHTLENKLKNVNLALEKIEKGEYGKCENCGKEIPLERLKAFPEAKVCSECNKKVSS